MAQRKGEKDRDADQPTEYTVVARRYRPQQFDQLVGQEPVAQALTNALTGGRVAHAYLFTGPRGVGKTSSARILAKALNCEKGPTPKPCDKCEICQSIASGDDVDVLEIDAASNRGIDDIRELRQNVQFRPSRARNKIYIIDEVHMLTPPAFNALLKTLEEPPAGVKFIMATTDVGKIPVTILSRCQRFDFALIQPASVAKHLRAIVTQEKLKADDEALKLVARRAAGSMRDAESLLDQLLAFGEPLTTDLVHRLIGTAPSDRILSLAQAIFYGDQQKVLGLFSTAHAAGANPSEILDQLIDFWRDLMLVAVCRATAPGLNESADVLTPLAQRTSIDVILAGIDVLTAAKAKMRFSTYGRVITEAAMVRLARLDQLLRVSEIWATAQQDTPLSSASTTRVANVPVRLAEPIDTEKKKLMMPSRMASPR
jgi:DNA polymerase-3 subunit gamma/tau